MPPKVKFSKEEIIQAAVELTREQGFEAVTARDVGTRLGTSSKPVYTAFASMQELKQAVIEQAYARYRLLEQQTMSEGKYPPYKSMGMAYIRFAKEEPNLFRLLFMRDRTGEGPVDYSYQDAVQLVQTQTGLDPNSANLFHAEMWMAVHGIAVIFATSYLDWDMELVSRMLTDFYQGLSARKEQPYGKHY